MTETASLRQYDVVRAVLDTAVPEGVAVFANGHISRTGHAIRDHEGDFFMLGSMGLAAGIGLGVATSDPDRPVVVVDGDGNVLMGLATLPLVGHAAPRRFLHVVLDNGCYASTGGQPTVAGTVDLVGLALSCGYREARRISAMDELREFTARAHRSADGPVLLHVPVNSDGDAVPPRVAFTPTEITRRVAGFLAGTGPSRGG